MTYFLQQPEGIFLRSEDQLLSVEKTLAPATYLVCVTPLGEYYLSKIEGYKRPPKTYGSTTSRAERILNTFLDRPNGTGVLLSGEQGSGKTLLARELSIQAAEQGIATIIVNSAFCGTNFNQFIQSIDIPAVVIIDEFEKMYDDEDQEKLLTLLDGMFPSKKLFVLTCNNTYSVNSHMLNRPGRIFYHLKYTGLEAAFITEYCEDVLNDKSHIQGVENIARHFFAFNFDMLKALVEEMNRYSIPAVEAVEMLNMSPMTTRDHEHKVTLTINGKEVESLSNDTFDGNPMVEVIKLTAYYDESEEDEKPISEAIKRYQRGRAYFEFSNEDLTHVDGHVYTFTKGNTTLILEREQEKQFKYMAY